MACSILLVFWLRIGFVYPRGPIHPPPCNAGWLKPPRPPIPAGE